MASQLYRMLNNIDKDRVECIKKLRSAGFEIKEDASLRDIGLCLDNLESDNNRLLQFAEDDEIKDPEKSPEIWHRPSDWPDLEQILKDTEDFIDETTGLKYVPFAGFILDNTENTNIFTIEVDGLASPEAKNKLIITTAQGYGSYFWLFKVQTSDGHLFDVNQSAKNVEHIWDKTQDIAGKYRYIICYETMENNYHITGAKSCVQNYLKPKPGYLNALEMIYTLPVASDSVVPELTNGAFSNYKMESLQMMAPQSTNGKTIMSGIASGSYNCNLYMFTRKTTIETNKLKYLHVHKLNGGSRVRVCLGTDSKNNNDFCSLNTLVLDEAPATWYTPQEGNLQNLQYVVNYAAKVFYTEGKYRASRSPIRYTAFTDETMKPTKLGYLALQNQKTLESNLPDSITTLEEGALQYALTNWKYLDLSGVTECQGYAIEYVGAQTVDLRNLKTLNHQLGILTYPMKIILDSLETVNDTIVNGDSVTELNLPSLKTVNANDICGKSNFIKLTKVSIPSLQVCSSPNTWLNNIPTLRYLELPNNFKIPFNLSGNTGLTKSTLLDILNKAADVTEEEEEYTLTLGTSLLARLTNEEKSIITDKGWVLK